LAGSVRSSQHCAFYPVDRSGAAAEGFGGLEDTCAGRQVRSDALDDIAADWATPEALPLCSGACEAGVDPAADGRVFNLGKRSLRVALNNRIAIRSES
jgi:hypothetical protein